MLTEMEKLELESIFINEVDEEFRRLFPREVNVTITVMSSIAIILLFIILSSRVVKDTKKDPALTKRINEILNTGNTYEVRILDTKLINAFAMSSNTIYVTKGLIKTFRNKPRIIEAVLLHEIGHVYNEDVVKRIMAQMPILFIMNDIIIRRDGDVELILIVYILSVLGLSFLYQSQEFRADSFAVKYGYGKDLIEFFNTVEVKKQKPTSKVGKILMKALKVLERFIGTHPSAKRRIERIINNPEFQKLKDKVKTEPAYVYKRIKSMVMED